MTWELWLGWGDVGPFREAGTPPLVVFGNWMELGEIERDQLDARRVPGSVDRFRQARWFGISDFLAQLVNDAGVFALRHFPIAILQVLPQAVIVFQPPESGVRKEQELAAFAA